LQVFRNKVLRKVFEPKRDAIGVGEYCIAGTSRFMEVIWHCYGSEMKEIMKGQMVETRYYVEFW